MKRSIALLAGTALLGACYHAVIDTTPTPVPGIAQQGSAPGRVYEIPWAHGFLWGLIPPSEVDAKAKCPGGVEKVETQMSFLNLVANAITSGIYSPMTITVTCAGK